MSIKSYGKFTCSSPVGRTCTLNSFHLEDGIKKNGLFPSHTMFIPILQVFFISQKLVIFAKVLTYCTELDTNF